MLLLAVGRVLAGVADYLERLAVSIRSQEARVEGALVVEAFSHKEIALFLTQLLVDNCER